MSRAIGFRRAALLTLVSGLLAVLGSGVLATSARAEAPAHWPTYLLANPSDARPAPPPTDGSAQDRADLDELVALQAGGQHATEIAYWTSQPTPTRWIDVWLTQVRLLKVNPVRTSRALGLLTAAMHDAVVAACDAKIAYRRGLPHDRDARIRSLATPDEISPYASVDAAIAAAAVTVLEYLLPGGADAYQTAMTEAESVPLWAGVATRSDVAAGIAIGKAVGALAVARGRADNADAIFHGTIPDFPGAWTPAPALKAGSPIPDEPMAGTWKPWLMTSGSQFRPGPPPTYGSPAWQKEADEVVAVLNNLTDDQLRIARFWADGAGTNTPPGHWMRLAIGLAVRDHLSTPETARMLASLGTAEADAFIACWDAKYAYWSGRPIGLIKGFASTIITPNFPSYISGHATVSGAASTVLGFYFPDDAATLRAQAEEAAVSRLYGGIHYRADNEVGLAVGREVGALAVARADVGAVSR